MQGGVEWWGWCNGVCGVEASCRMHTSRVSFCHRRRRPPPPPTALTAPPSQDVAEACGLTEGGTKIPLYQAYVGGELVDVSEQS